MSFNKRLLQPQLQTGVAFPLSTEGNMLAHYKFDDSDVDETGNYNAESSNITYSTGRFGKAGNFNGNKRVTLGGGSPFAFENTIKAFSFWIKPDTTSSRISPFTISATTSTSYFFNFTWNNSNSTFAMQCRNGSSSNQFTDRFTFTPTTNWVHIIVQRDGTEREIWFNGSKKTTTQDNRGSSTSSSWISYPSYSNEVKGAIGIHRFGSINYSDGLIDQFRIYDRDLTSSEISELYNESTY